MKKFVLIAALCSFLLCMLAGYYVALWMGEKDKAEKLSEVKAIAQTEPVIGDNTKIIYRYKYRNDKTVKEKVESAPKYLYGLDMEQVKGRLEHLKAHPGIGLFTAAPGQGKTFSLRCLRIP